MIAPTNTIHIATVPWDSGYSEVMYFENETARDSYLTSVTSYTDTNCTFIRKEEAVNVAVRYNDVLRSNYVWFYNSDFLGSEGQKFVGCFIDRIEYVSPERTKLYLKEDVWTTWCFLIDDWSDCYVKRQHVEKSSDVLDGYRLIDNLPATDLKIDNSYKINVLDNRYAVLYCTVPQELQTTSVSIIGNIPMDLEVWFFDISLTGLSQLKGAIDYLSTNSGNALYISTFPKNIIDKMSKGTHNIEPPGREPYDVNYCYQNYTYDINESYSITAYNQPPHPATIDGYTPKNNIMFNYPYIYYEVSNSNGDTKIFKIENTPTPLTFKIYWPPLPGIGPLLYVTSYNGANADTPDLAYATFKYSLYGGQPSNGLITIDTFNEWWSTNSNKTYLSLFSSIGNNTADTVFTNPNGKIGNSAPLLNMASSIASTYASLKDAENMNDRYRGYSTPNMLESLKLNTFIVNTVTLRQSDALRIDNFYSRYGYLIENITTPLVNSRSIFNYIETQGIHISGNLPDYARLQIAQAFDRGITIWHTTSNFGEYNDSIFSNNN